MLLSNSII